MVTGFVLFSSTSMTSWERHTELPLITFPKHGMEHCTGYWHGNIIILVHNIVSSCNAYVVACLSGPIESPDLTETMSTRFKPFDKYLQDPDLDLFNEAFVNMLVHKHKPERVIFEMKPDDKGELRRQFKSHGPRRLKEELQDNLLHLLHIHLLVL